MRIPCYSEICKQINLLRGSLSSKADISDVPDVTGFTTSDDVMALLAGYAAAVHDHDDRYFTESEVTTLLAGYATYILGEIKMFYIPNTSNPQLYDPGWEWCDGGNTTSAAYFGAFGTYARPDLRGKFLMGWSGGPMGQTGGEAEVTLTSSQMPRHRHLEYYKSAGSTNTRKQTANDGQNGTFENFGEYTGYEGGDQPHNNIPPYVTAGYAIYVGV